MPEPRAERHVEFCPVLKATPYTEEIVQATLDRIDALEAELNDLVEDRCVPERYLGQAPSNHKSALDLLTALQAYPNRMRDVVKSRCLESPDEQNLTIRVQNDSREILACSRRLQEWFNSPGTTEVPVAIQREVDAAFARHGLNRIVTIIAAGPPDEIDIQIEDVRTSFVLPREPRETHEDLFTVLRLPLHAATSPFRWPIVLGHEVGHHRLRNEKAQWLDQKRQDGFDLPENTPDYVLKNNEPAEGTLVLWQVDIISNFPFADVRREIGRQSEKWRPTGSLNRDVPAPKGDESGNPHHRRELSDAALDIAIIKRVEVANNWLTEIICDLIMVREYGPAGIAGLADHLIATNSMGRHSDSHPPGAIRLSMMIAYQRREPLGAMEPIVQPYEVPKFALDWATTQERVQQICTYLTNSESTIFSFVDKLSLARYNAASPDRQRAVLSAVDQLAWGIPPHSTQFDAYADSGVDPRTHYQNDHVAITVEDLLNASCLAGFHQANGRILSKVPIDRLTLKAIETIQALKFVSRGSTNPDIATGWHAASSQHHATLTSGGAILSARQIESRLKAPRTSERLIITPATFSGLKNPSVDLRLGTRFITFHRSSIASFDAVRNDRPRAVQRRHEVSLDQPFVLHPGEVVLASALEYVALPHNVAAQVITRSSYGRLGLITATAIQVHPYYRGCLTLELVNLGNVPLALYPGEQVAQLIFFTVGDGDEAAPTAPGSEIVAGSFVCPTGPEFPDVRVDKDEWLTSLRAGQHAPIA